MTSVLLKPLLFTYPRRSSVAARRSVCSSAFAGGLTQRMFQLKTDPLTGKSEWIVIEEEEGDNGRQTTPKALLATTSYLDMLNDNRRNRAYRLAIDKTVTQPCHVLDIGYEIEKCGLQLILFNFSPVLFFQCIYYSCV